MMVAFSKTGRFALTVEFMTDKERAAVIDRLIVMLGLFASHDAPCVVCLRVVPLWSWSLRWPGPCSSLWHTLPGRRRRVACWNAWQPGKAWQRDWQQPMSPRKPLLTTPLLTRLRGSEYSTSARQYLIWMLVYRPALCARLVAGGQPRLAACDPTCGMASAGDWYPPCESVAGARGHSWLDACGSVKRALILQEIERKR